LVDVVFEVSKPTTVEEVNNLLKAAAQGPLKGILDYTEDPVVSTDYNGYPASSIVDGQETKVMDGTMVKVMSWYDNETGYSTRVIDLARKLATSLM
jgi:glyceraldehyde 3-phosphate dehydrogenase